MASNTDEEVKELTEENIEKTENTHVKESISNEIVDSSEHEIEQTHNVDSMEINTKLQIDAQSQKSDIKVEINTEQEENHINEVSQEFSKTSIKCAGDYGEEESDLELNKYTSNETESCQKPEGDGAVTRQVPSPASLTESNTGSPAPPSISLPSTPDIKDQGERGENKPMDTIQVHRISSTEKKNELMIKLDGEMSKETLFQQRFFILASNYEEIIKMKDEYKSENEKLRLDNMQMKLENTRIFTEKLESKERENLKLQQTIDYLKRQLVETESKLKSANDDYRSLCLSYEEKILRLVQNLSVAEETLADTVYKLREQEIVRSRQERENRRQCERLQKEKDDLMQLALNGGQRIYLK